MSGKKVEDLPVENTGTPDPNLGQICSGWGPTSTASHVELGLARGPGLKKSFTSQG
jgi:hypothetical protein